MHIEVSCGIVPITYARDSEPIVFVIRHKNGVHWGFPKGHCEAEETYLQGASRELSEETGLQIDRILSSQPLVQKYSYSRGGISCNKTVFYFIASVQGKVILQNSEILEGRWVSLQKAISLFSFESSKEIAYEVANFLKIIL